MGWTLLFLSWVPGHLTASVRAQLNITYLRYLMYVEASSKIEAEWSELGSASLKPPEERRIASQKGQSIDANLIGCRVQARLRD